MCDNATSVDLWWITSADGVNTYDTLVEHIERLRIDALAEIADVITLAETA